ncbi:MAG: glycosyltransferase [Candidatus Flexifilum sp.]
MTLSTADIIGATALVFVSGALIVISAIAVLNALLFPRLRAPRRPLTWNPRVSILIPARNEAAVIGATVSALLRQTYPDFEIVLLDDHSQDGTADIARAAAAEFARQRGCVDDEDRLRIVSGLPLPEGWLGKTWACHQLSNHAAGDVLLFTDADVIWDEKALAALLEQMARTGADLLTVWPTQRTETWSERLVVPLMALVILGYLPVPLVHHTPFAIAAAANGQCLLFRRRPYHEIGGHMAVRGEIVEDIKLARRIKRRGFRLRMADGAGLIACRMYRSWPEVRDGFAKNIAAGYGGLIGLLLGTLFHWLVFLAPPLWLALGWLDPAFPAGLHVWPALPAALTLAGIGVRALTALATRQRALDALWMPVSALLMTAVAGRAVYWQIRYGGVRWKGRTIRTGCRAARG